MHHTKQLFAPLALLLNLAALPGAMAAPAFHVEATIALPGEGKWDYANIDAVHQRLFVTHSSQVQVIDLKTRQLVGAIAGTDVPHGVDFAPELNLGFISNGHANNVTVFALDSLAIRQQVKVDGKNPDAILYVPQSHQLYTFNGGSADVSVFDVPSMRLVNTIKAGGRPEFAVNDGAGHIFFNIEDKNAMEMIDIASGKIAAHWALDGCEEPSGLALDNVHGRLFSVCKNQRAVVTDARTGKRVAEFAIGTHPDAAVYDPATATVYVSNGDSATLTIAHQVTPDRYEVLDNVATAVGAKTMAFDAATKHVYLPTAADGKMKVLVVNAAVK
ncbi:YncE family protein [Duganella levis]|uniref:YncE family protein n=1 Tax=Duganella levis TaxID=2692169 RepID=A0ABW9W7K8_9BURK|nr:YncE family protein [Duganella levis]MYN29505.1 YncE family protein [Duganella levis]